MTVTDLLDVASYMRHISLHSVLQHGSASELKYNTHTFPFIFKGKAFFFLDYFALQDETNRLSRKVDKSYQPTTRNIAEE